MQTTKNGFDTDEHIAILKKSYKTGDIFDRADAMQKLINSGKQQKEVAAIFGLSEGSVTQTLKAGMLDGKYVKAVRDGDLERDAAILIADFNTTDSKSTEILEESIRRRERIADSMAKRECRKEKQRAAAAIAEAKEKQAEALALSRGAEKRANDAAKALEKAKDGNDLEVARREREDAEKTKKAAGRTWAKAQKELEQANERKEKLAAQSPPVTKKVKATQEDVREVAKLKGVKGIWAIASG